MMKLPTTNAASQARRLCHSPLRWAMLAAAILLATCIVFSRIASAQPAPAAGEAPAAATSAEPDAERPSPKSFDRNDALLASLTIFVLAVFVGFEVIAKVPPTLHTPLMSGSNAVSGITIVGALLVTGHGNWFISLIGMIAIVLAMINVVGGFVVTHRMLGMFRRK